MRNTDSLSIGDVVKAFDTIALANEGVIVTVDTLTDGFAVGRTLEGHRIGFASYEDAYALTMFFDLGPCPACGDHIDYCQGHGPMGDPQGYAVTRLHDDGVHSLCHPASDCREDN